MVDTSVTVPCDNDSNTVIAGLYDSTQTCDVEVLSNNLFGSLTSDSPINIATPDLTDVKYSYTVNPSDPLQIDVADLTISDLVQGQVEGTGAFEQIMKSLDKHIQREFNDGRITSEQYANVYMTAMTAALAEANKFVLNKDQAHWQAIQAQYTARQQAIKNTESLLSLEGKKFEVGKIFYEMGVTKGNYALTKTRIATSEAEHCLAQAKAENTQYTNAHLLPAELATKQYQLNMVFPLEAEIKKSELENLNSRFKDYMLDGVTPYKGLVKLEKDSMTVENSLKQYQLDNILPSDKDLKDTQKLDILADIAIKDYQRLNISPQQLELLKEQTETQRAKTLDTRTDGSNVTGLIGSQKTLQSRQSQSFKDDSQYKLAKLLSDSWSVQKTVDSGLVAPVQFNNATIDTVLQTFRNNLGL